MYITMTGFNYKFWELDMALVNLEDECNLI